MSEAVAKIVRLERRVMLKKAAELRASELSPADTKKLQKAAEFLTRWIRRRIDVSRGREENRA